jgi:hypothetical protein
MKPSRHLFRFHLSKKLPIAFGVLAASSRGAHTDVTNLFPLLLPSRKQIVVKTDCNRSDDQKLMVLAVPASD